MLKQVNTGLIAYEPTELLAAEQKVHEAEQEFAESFYHVGKELGEIKSGELYKALPGCNSWAQYCRLGRLDYQLRQADLYIKAAGVRPLLVDIPQLKAGTREQEWNLKVVEQLCRLPLDSDIKRASKKIATRIKRGDRLSRALAKEIVDAELGVEAAARKRKAKEIESSDTPVETLTRTLDWATLLLNSLGKMEATFWTDAEDESPGIVKRLTQEFSALVSLLRSRP